MDSSEVAVMDVKERVHARYNAYPHLSDYFPLLLNNGAVVKSLVAQCAHCQGDISKQHLRGEVRESVMGCFRVTAIGWCGKCDLLTPYLVHVIPDEASSDFAFVPLDFRGWPEQYDAKLLDFAPPAPKKVLASNTG